MSEWINISERFPEEPGKDILIAYERDRKIVMEIGYLCGDELIKGQSERYPYPNWWRELPDPPQELIDEINNNKWL